MELTKKFEKNTVGRDFVVGDLGGYYDWMEQWLKEVDFTVGVDRLFGVGDLIDRGPRSQDSLHWYTKIMKECVRGNHEQMMIDFHKGEFPAPWVLRNGGAWYVGMTKQERQLYVDAFDTMPYAIQVETDNGLIGITHAECRAPTWQEFMADPLKWTESKHKMPACLWGRDKITYRDDSIVEGVFLIIVGHTIVNEPGRLGNHHYIDTGASNGLEPTVVQIQGA